MYDKRHYGHLVKVFTDVSGNTILVSKKKTRTVFYLDLQKGSYLRNIGYIKNKDGVFYTKRSNVEHVYMKTNSFGFNRDLVDLLLEKNPNQKICIDTGRVLKHYGDLGELMKARQEHKNYKDQGYELQVFFPVSIFEQDLKR